MPTSYGSGIVGGMNVSKVGKRVWALERNALAAVAAVVRAALTQASLNRGTRPSDILRDRLAANPCFLIVLPYCLLS
jgi:hypothetical protein